MNIWSGDLSNPLQVIEQITYLIFIKLLDEMLMVEERKAAMLGRRLETPCDARRPMPVGAVEIRASWFPI
jgi:hypothetical protein